MLGKTYYQYTSYFVLASKDIHQQILFILPQKCTTLTISLHLTIGDKIYTFATRVPL